MPNGSDCSNLLQTEPLSVPTQWFFLDCTTQGVIRDWIGEDVAPTVDYCLLPRPAQPEPGPADSVEALKRALIQLRPAVLAELGDSYERRLQTGTQGRLVIWIIADLSDPLGALALAELPIDLSNRIFFTTGLAPAVLRCAIGGSEEEKRRTLALIKPQYFDMPDYSRPYYERWEPRELYSNEFDSMLLFPDRDSLRRTLSHLLPLHAEETKRTLADLQPRRSGGMLVIETAMARSRTFRRIDWLAVAMYPYFPRLWDLAREDVLDVLDFSRRPERSADPWAALKRRKREASWDHLSLGAPSHDLHLLEEPYRISPGDHQTRLPLARRLFRERSTEEAVDQLARARSDSADLPLPWLKLEGLILHGKGQEEAATALFRKYVERLAATNPEPSASVLDELGSVQLLLHAHGQAAELARRAIALDKALLHAYDTLIIASRESGDPQYEKEAVALARTNQVAIPILVREEAQKAHKPPRIVETTKPAGEPGEDGSGSVERGWVLLRSCRDNAEADVLRSVLKDAGIRCIVQGENHRSMLGFLGPYIELRLMVPGERLQEAKELLDATGMISDEELDASSMSVPEQEPDPEVREPPPPRQPFPFWIFLLMAGALVLYALLFAHF